MRNASPDTAQVLVLPPLVYGAAFIMGLLLHHDPGKQYSLGRVSHSSHTFFHYNISFVFDGKFPRTGQEVGEDTPKEKRENRMGFPYQQERISPEDIQKAFSS